jgi:hypothetical protein
MAVRAQGMIAAQIPCQKSSLYKSNCVPNTIGPDPFDFMTFFDSNHPEIK